VNEKHTIPLDNKSYFNH